MKRRLSAALALTSYLIVPVVLWWYDNGVRRYLLLITSPHTSRLGICFKVFVL